MSFIILRPRMTRQHSDVYTGDKVRISFPMNKGMKVRQLLIVIGQDVAKQYGLNPKDKAVLGVGIENPLIWQLIKVVNDPRAWTLVKVGKSIRFQMPWVITDDQGLPILDEKGKLQSKPIPAKYDHHLRFVSYRLVNRNLQIELSGALDAEKELNG
jgi:hypothetical protein